MNAGNSSTGNWPDAAVQGLLRARRVLVLTGAGMSAESGIPTFRDAQTGLWSRFRPEELATPEAFRAHPRRVWEWYEWRRDKVRQATPHPGYRALVELESLVPEFAIATQNVDGLHQAAGNRQVIELHGNILRTICSQTGKEIEETWIRETSDLPPTSPHADGGLARPDVVWFGEALPAEALAQAGTHARTADVILSIGTSSLVHPAASLPLVGLQAGALLIEVNPEPTPLSAEAHFRIRQTAGKALPLLMERLGQARAILDEHGPTASPPYSDP